MGPTTEVLVVDDGGNRLVEKTGASPPSGINRDNFPLKGL
jgi:hypothetical protein